MDQTPSPTRQELEIAIDDYAAAIHSNRPNLITAATKRLSDYLAALYEPRIAAVEPVTSKAVRSK